MLTIPKDGWKCPNCRICIECHSIISNNNKWHLNYTLCDLCYQQRSKGSSCHLCKKSYKQTSLTQLRSCNHCTRYLNNWS
jgi:[histone H3]-lysine4 N-trimethyltransferase MLL3